MEKTPEQKAQEAAEERKRRKGLKRKKIIRRWAFVATAAVLIYWIIWRIAKGPPTAVYLQNMPVTALWIFSIVCLLTRQWKKRKLSLATGLILILRLVLILSLITGLAVSIFSGLGSSIIYAICSFVNFGVTFILIYLLIFGIFKTVRYPLKSETRQNLGKWLWAKDILG